MRLGYYIDAFFDMDVSIHASVKDATPEYLPKNEYGYVSIHASVKDATHADDVSYPNENVSIHASVKDATLATREIAKRMRFQSTHL